MNARRRAEAAHVPFALTLEYVLSLMVEKCPALGIDLVYKNAGQVGADSATLDRTKPALGYVPGNVQVISHRANSIKSDAIAAEVTAVARWLTSLDR